MKIEKQYVHLPVKNGAEKAIFQFLLDGQVAREFDVELATDGPPDWWAFYDVSAFRGKEISIRARNLVGEDAAAKLPELIQQGDDIKGAENLYRETHRPQFHFTSRRGWNNDPNGMVYHNGEYHLYYQHNPFGIKWGNMHWGHAVSTDLAHWQELPIALYQNGLKDMAFSGGGNVDPRNTAGWKTGDEDVIFVSFTSTGRGECVAYSSDRGRTFTDYKGNPVIKHRGRDPKVVWYEPETKWVMVLYDEVEGKWRYAFYESRDLKSWAYMSAVDGFYECPEFFDLPMDGDERNRKWVLHGAERREEGGKRHVARSSYMVGAFDGRAFIPETGIMDGHLGPNFYAAQTFSNVPGNRRIMIGWLSGVTYPGMPFSQGFTAPLELTLRATPDGPRLLFYPVEELDVLRTRTHRFGGKTVAEADAFLEKIGAELLDILMEIEPNGADVELNVRGQAVTYRASDRTLSFRDKTARLEAIDGKIHLRALVDRCVMEVFGNQGRIALSAAGDLFPKRETPLRLLGGDAARVVNLTAHELKSMWG
ncbi:MAG: glycoside hydrolase family 32 protein [Planctomycetota bacterium]